MLVVLVDVTATRKHIKDFQHHAAHCRCNADFNPKNTAVLAMDRVVIEYRIIQIGAPQEDAGKTNTGVEQYTDGHHGFYQTLG